MARIPEDELERLKREISLVRLVESSGIELKKTGQDWFGRCPFHDDKTPSLSITPDKNLWHCLKVKGDRFILATNTLPPSPAIAGLVIYLYIIPGFYLFSRQIAAAVDDGDDLHPVIGSVNDPGCKGRSSTSA